MSKRSLLTPLPPPRFSRVVAALRAVVGGAGFLDWGAMTWESAREHQLSGQPMPNGKGGFMSYRGGYESALFLLVFGLVWLWSATRFMQRAFNAHRPEPPKGEPPAPRRKP